MRIVKYKNNGYIALTSAVIISTLILIISITLGFSSFLSRSNSLHYSLKEITDALAEGCVNLALVKLAQASSTYAGNESVPLDSDSCEILPIESGSGQKTIKASAILRGVTTNLKVIVNESNLSIISWEELSSF